MWDCTCYSSWNGATSFHLSSYQSWTEVATGLYFSRSTVQLCHPCWQSCQTNTGWEFKLAPMHQGDGHSRNADKNADRTLMDKLICGLVLTCLGSEVNILTTETFWHKYVIKKCVKWFGWNRMHLYLDHKTVCWRFGKTNKICLSYSPDIPPVTPGTISNIRRWPSEMWPDVFWPRRCSGVYTGLTLQHLCIQIPLFKYSFWENCSSSVVVCDFFFFFPDSWDLNLI